MFEATIAGSLPKPGWLAETDKLWPQWKLAGSELAAAKRDATLLWLKEQEDAGLDIVGDGEQSRQHFVHGFLEFVDGIDFEHKVEMGIRNDRYKAMVPQVVGPLKLRGRVHQAEALLARQHTKKKLKITLPGPMTIVDTVADRYYGDRVKMAMAFAELLNQEALALQADGVDVIQFDEPAFNVYTDDVKAWGIAALDRAAQGLTCMTVVHICYGYGIKANVDWKATLGSEKHDQGGLARVHEREGADAPDAAAGRQGPAGGRNRRRLRHRRDARAGRGHDRQGAAVRREGAPVSLHQLRHGADEARDRAGEAGSARPGRGDRTPALRQLGAR
jgi:methionine synthase II (cobalamin-independent)